MSFFRSVLFLVTFYFFTILLSIISLPLLALPHRFASHLGSFWGLIVNLCLKIIPIDFSIKGNVCKREQVIYAVKHQSAWETLILYWQLERPIVVLKKELLLIPIIGALMKRAGCIAVDRKAGISALRKLQREATVAKQTGRSILIFPQGTRVLPSDNTTPYQGGVFSIYQLLSLSVIPVALDSGHYWPSKTLLKKPGIINVVFMSPIKPGLPRSEFMTKLKHDIESCCAELEKKDN